jgi:hypothetical protein
MIELTMQEVCKKLHWHDSWAASLKYIPETQELRIELEFCEWINDSDFLFNGQEGILIFHGVRGYEIDVEFSIAGAYIEFTSSDCVDNRLQLSGLAYKDMQVRNSDWFGLRFYADSATWHPKNE